MCQTRQRNRKMSSTPRIPCGRAHHSDDRRTIVSRAKLVSSSFIAVHSHQNVEVISTINLIHQSSHQFLKFSVEPTPLAIFHDWTMDHPMDFHPVTAIEPSMQRISGRNNKGQQQSQGFFPKFLNSFFNSMVSTISVTVTNVFTRKIGHSNLLLH